MFLLRTGRVLRNWKSVGHTSEPVWCGNETVLYIGYFLKTSPKGGKVLFGFRLFVIIRLYKFKMDVFVTVLNEHFVVTPTTA